MLLSSAMSGSTDVNMDWAVFSVRKNGAKRLVDSVGDGGGQFAGRREAVDMGQFRHACRACTSARRRLPRSCSSTEISPAWTRTMAVTNAICHEYRAHGVDSRNSISLPGGGAAR